MNVELPNSNQTSAPMPPKRCSCGGEMEEGFLLDHGYVSNYVASWIPGKPEFGALFGLKGWKRKARPTQTFCCRQCGHLEMYADLASLVRT